MRKTKETHTFDFRPLGLAIREARERAGLSRNDLGDKVFYGERHIADIENTGSHPSFQLFHDLVTMFNISVDEYFYPAEKVTKSTARRQIETSLDLLRDNELKIIQGTIDGILNSRESKRPYGKVIDKLLVAGSDTVSFVTNLTHKSITPFWI